MKALRRIQSSIRKRGIRGILMKIPNSLYQREFTKRREDLIKNQNWDLYFECTLGSLTQKYRHRNDWYKYFNNHFENILGEVIKGHRSYYSTNGRGFGENAFHSMWYQIFREYRPSEILEIGVYRGQTISLFGILSRLFEIESNIYGITPLSCGNDEVSRYLDDIDYAKDIETHFKFFKLPPAKILKAYSTDKEAIDLIDSKKWDLIYIDGSHDFEVVKNDYEVCKRNLTRNGLLVFDDSSLYFDFDISFKGHPGPSKLVKEIVSNEMDFIIGVGHNNVFKLKN